MKQEWLQLMSKKVSKDKKTLWPIMPIKDRIQDILANSQKQTILLIKKLKNWEVLRVKVIATESCLTLCDLMHCSPQGSSVHGISPDKKTGLDSHSFLQGIFQPRERTWVSCTEGRFFMIWVTREAHYN